MKKLKSHYDTIIIGGGISGLSCARRLQDKNKDFLLISKELGGRMRYDDETGTNLGAGILPSNCKNVLKYLGKKESSSLNAVRKNFLYDSEHISVYKIIFNGIKNFPKLLKLFFFVWRFKRHLENMRKRLPFESVKQVIEKDKVLLDAFSKPAIEFVRENKLEEITEKYINPVIGQTFYTTYEKLNTYYYLGNLSPGLGRIYIPDFAETIKKITNGFEAKIYLSKVKKVNRSKSLFQVTTSNLTFTSKNIVFAAPEHSLRNIYPLPKPHIQQSVHKFIVQGERRGKYKSGVTIIFNPRNHEIAKIDHQGKYDFVTSHIEKPNFKKYYKSYRIKKHIYWDPATIIPNKLIDQNLEENAYLASDYNLCCLEDSFLTGLYAANQIISKGS